MTRKYELKQRALSQAETRQRIVDATVDLHRELGPLRTTISAIAERAGVQRLTVYRHFPDDRALFGACSSQWRAAHPMPDPVGVGRLSRIRPSDSRPRSPEIYAWFGSTEEMTANVLRDIPESPAAAGADWHLRGSTGRKVQGVLEHGWEARGERAERLRAVIGHALEFATWRSLARTHGLDDAAAADLMVRLARVV